MTSHWFLEFLRRVQILIGEEPSVARAAWVVRALPASVSVVEHHVVRSILTDYAARTCRSAGPGVNQREVASLLDVANEQGDTLALTNQFMYVIELCVRKHRARAGAPRARSCRDATAGSTAAARRAAR